MWYFFYVQIFWYVITHVMSPFRHVHGSWGDHRPALRPHRVHVQFDHQSVRNWIRRSRRGESRGGDGRWQGPTADSSGIRVQDRAASQGYAAINDQITRDFFMVIRTIRYRGFKIVELFVSVFVSKRSLGKLRLLRNREIGSAE